MLNNIKSINNLAVYEPYKEKKRNFINVSNELKLKSIESFGNFVKYEPFADETESSPGSEEIDEADNSNCNFALNAETKNSGVCSFPEYSNDLNLAECITQANDCINFRTVTYKDILRDEYPTDPIFNDSDKSSYPSIRYIDDKSYSDSIIRYKGNYNKAKDEIVLPKKLKEIFKESYAIQLKLDLSRIGYAILALIDIFGLKKVFSGFKIFAQGLGKIFKGIGWALKQGAKGIKLLDNKLGVTKFFYNKAGGKKILKFLIQARNSTMIRKLKEGVEFLQKWKKIGTNWILDKTFYKLVDLAWEFNAKLERKQKSIIFHQKYKHKMKGKTFAAKLFYRATSISRRFFITLLYFNPIAMYALGITSDVLDGLSDFAGSKKFMKWKSKKTGNELQKILKSGGNKNLKPDDWEKNSELYQVLQKYQPDSDYYTQKTIDDYGMEEIVDVRDQNVMNRLTGTDSNFFDKNGEIDFDKLNNYINKSEDRNIIEELTTALDNRLQVEKELSKLKEKYPGIKLNGYQLKVLERHVNVGIPSEIMDQLDARKFGFDDLGYEKFKWQQKQIGRWDGVLKNLEDNYNISQYKNRIDLQSSNSLDMYTDKLSAKLKTTKTYKDKQNIYVEDKLRRKKTSKEKIKKERIKAEKEYYKQERDKLKEYYSDLRDAQLKMNLNELGTRNFSHLPNINDVHIPDHPTKINERIFYYPRENIPNKELNFFDAMNEVYKKDHVYTWIPPPPGIKIKKDPKLGKEKIIKLPDSRIKELKIKREVKIMDNSTDAQKQKRIDDMKNLLNENNDLFKQANDRYLDENINKLFNRPDYRNLNPRQFRGDDYGYVAIKEKLEKKQELTDEDWKNLKMFYGSTTSEARRINILEYRENIRIIKSLENNYNIRKKLLEKKDLNDKELESVFDFNDSDIGDTQKLVSDFNRAYPNHKLNINLQTDYQFMMDPDPKLIPKEIVDPNFVRNDKDLDKILGGYERSSNIEYKYFSKKGGKSSKMFGKLTKGSFLNWGRKDTIRWIKSDLLIRNIFNVVGNQARNQLVSDERKKHNTIIATTGSMLSTSLGKALDYIIPRQIASDNFAIKSKSLVFSKLNPEKLLQDAVCRGLFYKEDKSPLFNSCDDLNKCLNNNDDCPENFEITKPTPTPTPTPVTTPTSVPTPTPVTTSVPTPTETTTTQAPICQVDINSVCEDGSEAQQKYGCIHFFGLTRQGDHQECQSLGYDYCKCFDKVANCVCANESPRPVTSLTGTEGFENISKNNKLKELFSNNVIDCTKNNTEKFTAINNCDCMEEGRVNDFNSTLDTESLKYRNSYRSETGRKWGKYGYGGNWCIIKDQTGESSCGVPWTRKSTKTYWKACDQAKIDEDKKIRFSYKNARSDDKKCESEKCKKLKRMNDCTCLETRYEANNPKYDPSPIDRSGSKNEKNTYGSGCGHHGFAPKYKWCLTYKQPKNNFTDDKILLTDDNCSNNNLKINTKSECMNIANNSMKHRWGGEYGPQSNDPEGCLLDKSKNLIWWNKINTDSDSATSKEFKNYQNANNYKNICKKNANVKIDKIPENDYNSFKEYCKSDEFQQDKKIYIAWKPWIKPEHKYYYKYENNCCYHKDYESNFDSGDFNTAKTMISNDITSKPDCQTKYGDNHRWIKNSTCQNKFGDKYLDSNKTCNPGEKLIGNECQSCPEGYYSAGGRTEECTEKTVKSCDLGFRLVVNSDKDNECKQCGELPANSNWDPESNDCGIICDSNYILVDNSCVPKSCTIPKIPDTMTMSPSSNLEFNSDKFNVNISCNNASNTKILTEMCEYPNSDFKIKNNCNLIPLSDEEECKLLGYEDCAHKKKEDVCKNATHPNLKVKYTSCLNKLNEEQCIKDGFNSCYEKNIAKPEKDNNFEILEMRKGIYSKNKKDRVGHIFGLETYGPNIDLPDSDLEYPLGKPVVLFSLIHLINMSIKENENDAKNTDFKMPDNEDVDLSIDEEARTYLSSSTKELFSSKINSDNVWYIQRVKGLDTFDFDYLKDLDRSVKNKKSLDGIVYCIRNSKQQFLNNDFRTDDFSKKSEGKSRLIFSDKFIPKKCGWIIKRENKNNYSFFSMSKFIKKDLILDSLQLLGEGELGSALGKVIENSDQKKYPFGYSFLEPYFSSASSDLSIIMSDVPDEYNSWTIIDINNNILNDPIDNFESEDVDNFINTFKNIDKEFIYKPTPCNEIVDLKKLTEIEEIKPWLNEIEKKVPSEIKNALGDDIIKGAQSVVNFLGGNIQDTYCKAKLNDEGAFCERLPNEDDTVVDTVLGGSDYRCMPGRGYGEFCSWLKNIDPTNHPECGKDTDGNKFQCKMMFQTDCANCCRYADNSRELGQTCGAHEECKGHTGSARCCGTIDKKKMGEGICTTAIKDYAGIYWCPDECRGCVLGGEGTCNMCPSEEERKGEGEGCCYDHQCKDEFNCSATGKCISRLDNYKSFDFPQFGCTPKWAVDYYKGKGAGTLREFLENETNKICKLELPDTCVSENSKYNNAVKDKENKLIALQGKEQKNTSTEDKEEIDKAKKEYENAIKKEEKALEDLSKCNEKEENERQFSEITNKKIKRIQTAKTAADALVGNKYGGGSSCKSRFSCYSECLPSPYEKKYPRNHKCYSSNHCEGNLKCCGRKCMDPGFECNKAGLEDAIGVLRTSGDTAISFGDTTDDIAVDGIHNIYETVAPNTMDDDAEKEIFRSVVSKINPVGLGFKAAGGALKLYSDAANYYASKTKDTVGTVWQGVEDITKGTIFEEPVEIIGDKAPEVIVGMIDEGISFAGGMITDPGGELNKRLKEVGSGLNEVGNAFEDLADTEAVQTVTNSGAFQSASRTTGRIGQSFASTTKKIGGAVVNQGKEIGSNVSKAAEKTWEKSAPARKTVEKGLSKAWDWVTSR